MKFGDPPVSLGKFDIESPEVFYYLYLPISLPRMSSFIIPPVLKPFIPLFSAIKKHKPSSFQDKYVYVTGKKMFCGPLNTANRPGWHSDGFGTDDVNYIWYDSLPTIFNNGPFNDISNDDRESLQQFEDQALPANNYTMPTHTLLKLTPSVIHKVQGAQHDMIRTFLKISVSSHQYDLKNNSINHELPYKFNERERVMGRNVPNFIGQMVVV